MNKMTTIILGNTKNSQSVFNYILSKSEIPTFMCKSIYRTYAKFRNGDYIGCLSPNENIRGQVADIIYVPCNMTVEDVRKYGMYLSHGRDIEVVVYRVNQ